MDDWNRDDWQGKRRDQVESSMRAFGYFSILLLLSIAGVLIVEGLKFLL